MMQAIYGPDGSDLTVRAAPFRWDEHLDWKRLRVGYAKSAFEREFAPEKPPESASAEELKQWEVRAPDREAARARAEYDHRYDVTALNTLRSMGVELQVVELPDLPLDAIALLLNAEAAAAFDDLTLTNRDELLTEQGPEHWPNLFRVARFYPAIEYIQANRARTLAMRRMANLFQQVDVIVVPSSFEGQLVL